MIDHPLDEQIQMQGLPLREPVERGIQVQPSLWRMFVVQLHEAVRRLQVMHTVEPMRVGHLLEPPVEALDHSVGVRVLGPC